VVLKVEAKINNDKIRKLKLYSVYYILVILFILIFYFIIQYNVYNFFSNYKFIVLDLLDIVFIPAIAPLILDLIAYILKIYNKIIESLIISHFIGLSTFVALMTYEAVVLFNYINYFLFWFLFFEFFVIIFFALTLFKLNHKSYWGFTLLRLSISDLILSFYILIISAVPSSPVQYIFLFPFAVSIFFSLAYFIEHIDSLKNLGKYMILYPYRWMFFSFLIGVLYAVMSDPSLKKYESLAVLATVVIILIIIIYFSLLSYYYSSRYLDSITNELYKKHKHEPFIMGTENIGFVNEALKNFVMYGVKDNLIVLLSQILTVNGMQYNKILDVLQELLAYKELNILEPAPFLVKRYIEREMYERNMIVERIFNRIYKEVENVPK